VLRKKNLIADMKEVFHLSFSFFNNKINRIFLIESYKREIERERERERERGGWKGAAINIIL
jgi:hypothetical protein